MQISPPVTDKTIKLWKVSERDKRPEGYNLKDEEGRLKDISTITSLQVRALTCKPLHAHLYFGQSDAVCIELDWRALCSFTRSLTLLSFNSVLHVFLVVLSLFISFPLFV